MARGSPQLTVAIKRRLISYVYRTGEQQVDFISKQVKQQYVQLLEARTPARRQCDTTTRSAGKMNRNT